MITTLLHSKVPFLLSHYPVPRYELITSLGLFSIQGSPGPSMVKIGVKISVPRMKNYFL